MSLPIANLPQADVYPGPYVGNPTAMCMAPTEGPRYFPFGITWGTISPTNRCVSFNLQNQGVVNPLSKISCIYVDNSSSANVATVIFTDTNFEIEAPAFSEGYYNVITNGLQFIIVISGTNPNDVTNGFVLNFPQSEVNIQAVPESVLYGVNSSGQLVPVEYQLDSSGAPTFQVPSNLPTKYVSATIAISTSSQSGQLIITPSWTLNGFEINCSGNNINTTSSESHTISVQLLEGTTPLFERFFTCPAPGTLNASEYVSGLLIVPTVSTRFLNYIVTVHSAGTVAIYTTNINVFYS